ncbi:MAG: DNA polymerase III subunit gamma/tau [Ruminococcus sp.]|nr:DNA polymerase III subunit gamma/tau [Ruminococcus sp.]
MYQALYRKWRPMSFDDVVSQPHITTTLKNQIIAGKTAHAYLFTGSRGTGKTTCARILAKAVNCLSPKDGEPCLECEICKLADKGALADIIEIDAASNSRVDDIRELRDGVSFTPEMCKYKVYIIDEVHMLSPGAFNALLKTMEEPPEHVKFILATTEIHKVPETIVSRCQHFDFFRIRTDDIVKRLGYIAGQEGFTLHDDAAQLIARLSDGGMRDALSLLDKCATYSDDITVSAVSSAAGIAGRDHLFDILEAAFAKDAAGMIRIIDGLYDKSKDMAVLCSELITQMRNVMILMSGTGTEDLVVCLPEELERLKAMAAGTDIDTVLANISALQGCSERFRSSSNKCIELEMCAVKMCTRQTGKAAAAVQSAPVASAALGERIARLEAAVASIAEGGAPAVRPAVPPKKELPPRPLKKFDPNNYTPLNEWQEILALIKQRSPAVAAFLKNSAACIEGDMFYLIVASDFALKKFKLSDDAAMLKQVVNEYYGKTFGFKLFSSHDADMEDQDNPIKELIKRAEAAKVDVEVKKGGS